MNTSTDFPARPLYTTHRNFLFTLLALAGLLAVAAAPLRAQVQAPTLSLSLSPDTIGAGSCTELTITITNPLNVVATNMVFTLNLPAGVTLATPADPRGTCDGTITAPNGGSVIALNGGRVSANSTCRVRVGITSSTDGTFTLTTSGLSTSAGSSGPASVDLTVAQLSRPGFTKAFSPGTIQFGNRSTLTYTIENQNEVSLTNLTFTDVLPPGVEIAGPANVATDCQNATVTAIPGTNTISLAPAQFGFAMLDGLTSCTISVDVVGSAVGMNNSISSDLTFSNFQSPDTQSAGRACAILEVLSPGALQLTKRFLADPVAPGGTTTLEFTLTNLNRNEAVTAISFTDDLDAALSGLTATLPSDPDPPCGPGSTLTGSGLLTLTGGSLGPGASCTFRVVVNVPAGAPTGAFPNTTSGVTGDSAGRSISGTPASDTLFVQPVPIFTKSFTDDPVGAGDTVTLEYTITNTSSTSPLSDIEFTDVLGNAVPGIAVSGTLPTEPCGPSSVLTFFPGGAFDPAELTLSGGSIAAGETCTFSIVFQLPPGLGGASYPSTSGPLTGNIGGAAPIPVSAPPASDDLVVVPPVQLTKTFTDDPVLPGDTVTLEFTLSNTGEGAADATNVSFTDDLEAALSGLAATGLPLSDVCGAGSLLSGSAGDTFLTFTGGSLQAGETCTFSVTLVVPTNADQDSYTNTTSAIDATVLGVATSGSPASAELLVGGLSFTKEFLDDPVIPGQTATLEFTLTNDGTEDATGIQFNDNLDEALAGLAVTGTLPTEICGGTLTLLSGNTLISYQGGSVPAGQSCSFQLTVLVPESAANGTYRNTSSPLQATIAGNGLTVNPAIDDLEVDDSVLVLTKEFIDDPVAPGSTATLEFTISNLSQSETINNIVFTDDLEAALAGLVAVGLPQSDVCGAGSQISGTSVLTLSGGSVAPGASCTFSVTIQVPASIPPGAVVINTTSAITGNTAPPGATSGGVSVSGPPASDTLLIESLVLGKSFSGAATPGGTVELTFTIENVGTTSVSDLAFTDDLDAVIPGLAATGLPANDVCGAGSVLAGTSLLTLTGASLGPGETCTFDVTLQVPPSAGAGSFPNTTSDLRQSGVPVASPATASLEIVPALAFSKAFAPASIGLGQVSTLTFTLDNTANQLDATSVDFTDVLPAGVVIATPSNAGTDCAGGTLTAPDGGTTISYSGGTVPGGTTCTITVDVIGSAPGMHLNTTGDLTSSLGLTAPASATLTVNPQPGFAKAFAPDAIAAGGRSTLTFTIDNTGSSVDATGLDFSDTLPAGLVIADPANAATTCTGGTLTAVPGSNVVSYAGGTASAGASCTVTVDVTTVEGGTYANTSGDLTSSLGNSGTASDSLDVQAIVSVALSKTESADPVVAGSANGNLVYTITARNGGPSTATGVTVSEVLTLPAGVTVDSITPSAGTFTDPTWDLGTLAAGATETLTVVLTVGPTAQAGTDVISDTATLESVNEDNIIDGEPFVTESTSIVTQVDIVVSKTESADPVVAGSGNGNLSYEVTVRNDGPSHATGVRVVDGLSLPPFVTLDSITPSAGTTFAGSNWTIGDLAPGASATLTAVLTVGELAPEGNNSISNTAVLNAVDQPDGIASNNSATVETSIANEVDLAITKMDSIDPVIAGSGPGNLMHTVTVTNAGPSGARNARIGEVITLPAGVTIDSIVPDLGTYDSGTDPDGVWTLNLPPGESATLTVTFTVAPDAPNNEAIVNTASLLGLDGTDTNPANDSATEETTILAGVDLVVTKTESIDPVTAGSGPGNLSYEVTVVNNGPLDATGVEITEQLAFGPFVGVEEFAPSAGTFAGTTWFVGDLANGASETLTVVLTVGPSAFVGTDSITNTAFVSAVDQPQINTGDESATEATSIEREVDIVVTVTESRDPVLAGFALPDNLVHTVTATNLGPSDASDLEIQFGQVLPPGVSLNGADPSAGTVLGDSWLLSELQAGAGAAQTLALRLGVPATTPGGVDTISTLAEFVLANEIILNGGDDLAMEATSVVSPASMAVSAGDIALDIQTALFKQTITVTNNNPLAVPGFRVLVNGLPADVSVHNAQGESGGTSFLLYGQSLAAGGSVDLEVEYFQEGAAGGFDPTFTVELLDPSEVVSSPEGAALERVQALPNGDILLEFSSTPGAVYTVQYSHDGIEWFNVVPDVTAGGSRTQWIDNGPPKTPTHPSETPTRLYRVVTQ